MDDHLLHQIADTFRHVGTSDRNFYDRYYFNMHSSSDELFVIMGMGQYPNLAVQDAFALVRRGRKHSVVRGSRVIDDRGDTSVGPLRVEVIEGLKKMRFIVEPNRHGIEMDVRWEGAIPAFEEPRQYVRKHGRILYDTMRFAQTGYWTGSLRVGDETFEVTPDRWWGARDHSWGVRPVGEPEPAGIRQGELSLDGMWNYAPMQFNDFTILYICHERNDGERPLEEAVRIWNDPAREPEWLGRSESEHVFRKGTRYIERSTVSFPKAPGGGLEVKITPLIECYVGIGTGYGFEADWLHGKYQGELVVQGVEYDVVDDAEKLWGLCDTVARFELGSEVGYGLFEHGFFGPFDRYGLKGFNEGAP
jgi:hypothetical protein